MTPSELRDRLDRARELLRDIHHVALSTVNADGTPHGSPVFAALDGRLKAYWSSHPESLHSRNIARDGRVFLVIFDSRAGHGGLYIQARASALPAKPDLELAHDILEQLKQQSRHTMGDISRYTGNSPQRLYQAVPERLWVNFSERDQDGLVLRDRRHEVSLGQLLAHK